MQHRHTDAVQHGHTVAVEGRHRAAAAAAAAAAHRAPVAHFAPAARCVLLLFAFPFAFAQEDVHKRLNSSLRHTHR